MNDVQMLAEHDMCVDEERAQNEQFRTYTFVDVDNNELQKFENMVLSESEVKEGGLVVFAVEAQKPRYYSVRTLDNAARRVELTVCKNAYGKIALLFFLLGVSWLVIDYITKNIF